MFVRAPISPLQPALFGRPPSGQPRLNIAHPLASGLFAAYVLNKSYTAENLVTGARSDIDKNQASGDGGLADHRGMRFVAANGGSDDDRMRVASFDVQAADVVSFAIGFTVASFLITNANGHGVLGAGIGSLSYGPFVRIRDSGGTQRVMAGLKMPSSWGSWSDHADEGNPAVNLDEPIGISCCVKNESADFSDEGRIFQGQQKLSMAGPGFHGSLATGDDDLYLGLNNGSAHTNYYNFNGHIAYYYSWKRALTNEELKAVNANPYAPFGIPLILDDAVPDMLWKVAAGGGGPEIISGSVAISGVADIDVTGVKIGVGSIGVSGMADVAVSGAKIAVSGVVVSGAAALAIVGQKIAVSAVAMAGEGGVFVAGMKISGAAVDLSAEADIDATGVKVGVGAVGVSATADIDAIGTKIAIGTIALNAVGEAVIIGVKTAIGTISISAEGVVMVLGVNPNNTALIEVVSMAGMFDPVIRVGGFYDPIIEVGGVFDPLLKVKGNWV